MNMISAKTPYSSPRAGDDEARDLFAAAAIQGLIAKTETTFDAEELADQAFKIARAMMERREVV